MSAPRVLLLGAVLGQPMGGVRRHNAELLPRAAQLLAEGGGSLSVLCGRLAPAFELPAPIARLSSSVPPGPPAARAFAEQRALNSALRGARRSGRPFQLVHSAHQPLPWHCPVPLCWTVHDLRQSEAGGLSGLGARALLSLAAHRCARILVVSHFVRAQLLSQLSLAPERVCVVGNGCDHLPLLPRAVAQPPFLLCVAHLEPRKNLELLLQMLALAPDLPGLLLVGAAKGRERVRLEQRARELGVAARVRFLGAVADEQLTELYARAAALVLPSRIEGFGLPVLEAQRAGLPTAVARAGALPEVGGAAAQLFDPDDAQDAARAVRRALELPASAVEDARQRTHGFGWQDAAVRLVAAWCAAAGES